MPCEGLDDPKLDELLPADAVAKLREEVEMARGLCPDFDLDAYREGTFLTPVYFGSAINNFGVRELLDGIGTYAPSPRPQPTAAREIAPDEEGQRVRFQGSGEHGREASRPRRFCPIVLRQVPARHET